LLDIGGERGVASELTAVRNDGVLDGLVAGLCGEVLDLADDGLAIENLTEDDVLSVEVGSRNSGDEELGAIGV
jgi:hypothetical protein